MKIQDRKTVYNGFFQMKEVTLKTNDKTIKQEQFERGHSVAALVYDTARSVYILTRQYRVGAERKLTEIVAGSLDKDNETREETMEREIKEETGYAVDKLQPINEFYPSPGSCTEKIYMYYVEVSHKITEGGGTGDENIEIIKLSPSEFSKRTFYDGKTLVAQYWLANTNNT